MWQNEKSFWNLYAWFKFVQWNVMIKIASCRGVKVDRNENGKKGRNNKTNDRSTDRKRLYSPAFGLVEKRTEMKEPRCRKRAHTLSALSPKTYFIFHLRTIWYMNILYCRSRSSFTAVILWLPSVDVVVVISSSSSIALQWLSLVPFLFICFILNNRNAAIQITGPIRFNEFLCGNGSKSVIVIEKCRHFSIFTIALLLEMSIVCSSQRGQHWWKEKPKQIENTRIRNRCIYTNR